MCSLSNLLFQRANVPTSKKHKCRDTKKLDGIQDTQYVHKRIWKLAGLAELDQSAVWASTLERQMYRDSDRLTQIMQMRTTNRRGQEEQYPGLSQSLKSSPQHKQMRMAQCRLAQFRALVPRCEWDTASDPLDPPTCTLSHSLPTQIQPHNNPTGSPLNARPHLSHQQEELPHALREHPIPGTIATRRTAPPLTELSYNYHYQALGRASRPTKPQKSRMSSM